MNGQVAQRELTDSGQGIRWSVLAEPSDKILDRLLDGSRGVAEFACGLASVDDWILGECRYRGLSEHVRTEHPADALAERGERSDEPQRNRPTRPATPRRLGGTLRQFEGGDPVSGEQIALARSADTRCGHDPKDDVTHVD